MKTIFSLAIAAFMSAAFISCTKDQLSGNDFVTSVNNNPEITSKIFTKSNDPAPLEFGANTVISTGSRLAIYLPYGINKDVMQTATITLTDAATEETLGIFNLLESTHSSAATLNIPTDLAWVPFKFAAIDIDNTYTGRTITIRTHLAGQVAVSDDVFANAFSVQ
jgi:hypothetical protein